MVDPWLEVVQEQGRQGLHGGLSRCSLYILRHFPHNIYDLFKALGKDPLNTGHLALLPLVSALTAWLIWRALSTPPRKDLVAPSPEGYTVSGPWAEFMPPLSMQCWPSA